MIGWTEYTLALVAFTASHFVPRIGDLRGRLIERVGRRVYFSVYGLISIALLIWVISAAGRAPFVELWPQSLWMRWLPNLAMPLAVVLIVNGIGIAQPFTLGGKRQATFDPADPGFAAISRHPLFLALALWSLSHLVVNGDLAHAILFGLFGALALVAIPIFDAQARHTLGPDTEQDYFRVTHLFSLTALGDRAWRGKNGGCLVKRTAIGLALWAVLLMSHTAVIGVSPLP